MKPCDTNIAAYTRQGRGRATRVEIADPPIATYGGGQNEPLHFVGRGGGSSVVVEELWVETTEAFELPLRHELGNRLCVTAEIQHDAGYDDTERTAFRVDQNAAPNVLIFETNPDSSERGVTFNVSAGFDAEKPAFKLKVTIRRKANRLLGDT